MNNAFAACLLGLSLAVFSTAPAAPAERGSAVSETAFQKLAEDFVSGYLAWRPLTAVSLGLHQYDGRLTDFGRESLDAELRRLEGFDEKLASVHLQELRPDTANDLRVLRLTIASERFGFEDADEYRRNPMVYAGALDVNVYLKRDFAPLAERLKSIVAIENQAPGLFAAARTNLAAVLPKPQVGLAITIARSGADFLTKDLVEAVREVKDASLQTEFKQTNERAAAELRSFADWLEQERLPRATDDFALGREKYRRFLAAHEAITLAPERLLEIGMAELKREQEMFTNAAKVIDAGKAPIDVFQEIQRDHPKADALISDTRKNLEGIRQFLIDRQLITIPSTVRATVAETPSYLRATSFASMDTPGPFETKGAEAYYYVTPTESSWTEKEKDEWLTAFNHYTADVVSIHEAYPGHYVQFLHLNASPVSRAQKIFGSYAFNEGWAHYCEQMVLDEGFGGTMPPVAGGSASNAAAIQAAKYRLAQSDEALLRICRLCVSIRMHCQGMSVEDGAKFFRENCYYEAKPAMQEALRGTYDPGYLFYTLGKLELLKLRRDYKAQEGAGYSLKKFNDAVCDHGQMPVRFLRDLLLEDKSLVDAIL